MVNKIDSNQTSGAYAEETSLKVLPGTPVWKAFEPNEYSDFGAEITTVARTPINASRQRKKGVVTDLDASGGFGSDVTNSNMIDLLQGFFFADAREKTGTANLNDTAIPITNVDGTTEDYDAASGLDAFKVGDLVEASGFGVTANNGLKRVTVAAATALTVAEDLTNEVTPPAAAKLENVGFQFPSADLDIDDETDGISLVSAATDMTTLGLIVGEWIFVGGDSAATRFVNTDPGYGRIKSISTTTIVLDDTTFTATDETGTGLTIQIFFGTVLKNEATAALIKRRSYQLERQLGEDDNGMMSEYLVGAIANEFTLNVPQAEMLKADLSFVGLDVEQRTGIDGIKSGTRVAALAEDGYNTSSDVYRQKMYPVGATINPTALFAYLTEADITINNGVTPSKAVGTLGGFDATAGDFEVGGSLTAYFADIAGVQAVRNNLDIAFNVIFAQSNAGMVYDIPLLTLGGGRVTVEKDTEVKIPLESSAAENTNGYTMMAVFFQYLPSVGMPA